MDHLEEISVADLQQALDEAEGKKPTLRLVAAIAYKNGVTQTELAEWLDVERRTVYSWLKRLERGALVEAVTDADRPGRPRKLTRDQRERLAETLHEPPTDAGYDAPAWTPELVREHVAERFDVDYSVPSCRRLMKEAGLRYRKPPRPAGGTDSDDGDRDERSGAWVPE